MKLCRYRKKCKHYEADCYDHIYCGIMEDFMPRKEAAAFTKKHLGYVGKDARRGRSR